MAIGERVRIREVEVSSGSRILHGQLDLPAGAVGIVVFAHGSGSGRYSPRNQFVADRLGEAGLGTLLLDLLNDDEAEDQDKVFDIELLAERLLDTTHWCQQEATTRHLPLGYFGASTGAGAALLAASREPDVVKAVVSRGGRPDLAFECLPQVRAPVLLIVGGDDGIVVALNRKALDRLPGEKQLVIIPGATHLFPEAGALEKVAKHARAWFVSHLRASAMDRLRDGV